MKKYILAMFFVLFVAPLSYASATSPGEYYVTSEKLNVRLEPNKNGKRTNILYKGQKVEVFEIKNSWARISRYDDSPDRGQGVTSRWVFAKHLSTNRPKDEKEENLNSPLAKAIKSSDDFSKYQGVFLTASEKLVKSGKCQVTDFKEMGGWVRSTNHKPKPVYFTYCGGMSKNNRIYLNTGTGETFK